LIKEDFFITSQGSLENLILMKTIKIHRPDEFINKRFSYQILIDNNIEFDLKTGETKLIEFPANAERKYLQAKIQWCGSKIINLENVQDQEKIVISSSKFLNYLMPIIGTVFLLCMLMFFNLELFKGNFIIGIIALFSIVIIAFLTIGKNQWLNVKFCKSGDFVKN